MKRVGVLCVLLAVVGCTVFPPSITKPTDMSTVPGGLSDVRPFFGNYKLAIPGAGNEGLFLLASCGCGDWRVLMKPDNGSRHLSLPVQFYTPGEYQPTGMVEAYGDENYTQVRARVDQDGGVVTGQVLNAGINVKEFTAARTSQHQQPVEACGLCHIGEDTVYPLPSWHPQKYRTNPYVCLECHTVNGE